MRSVSAVLAALLPASLAFAHDPPELIQVVSSKRDNLVLATNRGLVFSDAQAGPTLLCNLAVGVRGITNTTEPYRVALLPSGRLLVASSEGLSVSDDRGCSFRELTSLPREAARALVQDPRDAQRLYVATTAPGAHGLYTSGDGGESFQKLHPLLDSDYVSSQLLVPSTPTRLYATYFRLAGRSGDSHHLLRSSDGGGSWEESVVPLLEGELDLTLLAFHPTRPEELLARASAADPARGERLLASSDGGRTFQLVTTLKVLKSASYTADGSAVYVASAEGLWRGSVQPGQPLTLAALPSTGRMSLVRDEAGELLVAGLYRGPEAADDGLARVQAGPDGSCFEPLLQFREVQKQSCAEGSRVSQRCAALFLDWQREQAPLATPPSSTCTPDAGPAPASDADAGATPEPARKSDGCAAHQGRAGRLDLGLLALAALLLRGGRRKRKLARN